MSFISDHQRTLLRARPHRAKLYLSIFQPKTVLACQYNNATGTVGAYVLPYDSVVTGSYSNVTAGMTMLVGTQPGMSDVGRIRVRSATASQITVAENADINWRDNLHLTVIKFYELWPRMAYYELMGEVIPYKDYDIAYTNQNNQLGSLICMGPHHAGWKGQAVYYSATGTVHVGGDTPSYSWSFEGGVPATSTALTPGWVNYPNPGHFTTALTVSATGTSTPDTSYRHVSIYNSTGLTNRPILNWKMDALSGSIDGGGYSTKFYLYENIGQILDGSLVVVFTDTEYGTTRTGIGGNAQNRSSVFYVGYIKNGTVKYNYKQSIVEFESASITELMKSQKCSGISVDSVVTPTSWFELPDMDVQRAVYHFLKWHTTVNSVADVQYIGDNRKFQYFETDPSTMFDAIETFTSSSLRARMIADRQGKVFIEQGPENFHGGMTGTALGLSIDRQDWMGEPQLETIYENPLAYLEMGGVAWSGANTGTYDAFISAAPGNVSAVHGRDEEQQGLILTSQVQLNELTGDAFAYENARYPALTLNMAGTYSSMEIVPRERHLMTVLPEDTQQHITLTNHPFHLISIDWEYDPQHETLLPTCVFHELTQGYLGTTVPIIQAPVDNFPPQPDTGDPGWPIFPPWRPVGPIEEAIPPEFPPIPPECRTDMNWPPNGPYVGFYSVNLHSDSDVNHYIIIPWEFFMRSGGATYKTTVELNGCFEYSDDAGTTWYPSLDTSWPEVYARDAGQIVAYGVCQGANARCETRKWVFFPSVGQDCNHVVIQVPKTPPAVWWSPDWPMTRAYRVNIAAHQWNSYSTSFPIGSPGEDAEGCVFWGADSIVDVHMIGVGTSAEMTLRIKGYYDSEQFTVYGSDTPFVAPTWASGGTPAGADILFFRSVGPGAGYQTVTFDISGYAYIRFRLSWQIASQDDEKSGTIAYGYVIHTPRLFRVRASSCSLFNICEYYTAHDAGRQGGPGPLEE